MERGLFESTFRAAAAQALEFARTFIEEPLPDALRFSADALARFVEPRAGIRYFARKQKP